MNSLLASIVVPSYKRPKALLELIDKLGQQTYNNFEIIIVEQSQDRSLVEQLEHKRRVLGERSVAVRLVIADRPLGCPGARNRGIPLAKGDVIVLFDDDDLPISCHWLATLMQNFHDPNCIGAVGRLFSTPNGDDPPPRFPRLSRALGFRYSLFKYPRAFAFGSLRKTNLKLICPSGAALRKSLFEKVGGFDEGLHWGEDNTLSFKISRIKDSKQYLVFDPRTGIWRRTNVEGGLERRCPSNWHLRELKHRMIYQHKVVGYYFPWRFRLFYPAFILSTLPEVLYWIWDPDNAKHGFQKRMQASASVAMRWPHVYYDVLSGRDCPTITRCPQINFLSSDESCPSV